MISKFFSVAIVGLDAMFSAEEVIETFEMISLSHLNVRTVTLGINLLGCADSNIKKIKEKVYDKIVSAAGNLVREAELVERKYGIPIVNKRIAVTPVSLLLESAIRGMAKKSAVARSIEIAEVLDKAAKDVRIDFIGGYGALVQKGFTRGDTVLIDSIPEALASTERVCSCVNIAGTKAGINVDAALKMGSVVKQTAIKTKDRFGIGCAKLVCFANAPEDNPFMAGAFHGPGESENTINVGISGPGVIRNIVEKSPKTDFRSLTELIKRAAFKITRAGELIGQEVARSLDVKFGIVDLSLAPTPEKGDSIASIIEEMGVEYCGAPGSTAALMLLTDAVKKGGSMATSFVGGISGAFIPVSEDAGMVRAATKGALTLEKLEAMTSVCSAGLDMIAIPGNTSSETIAAIILDVMAIGVINNKALGVRLIPVPGKKASDTVQFGGLFGGTVVMPVSRFSSSNFVKRGGHIPSPLASLRN